jgi:signal transduction protein with GAF and PtsI domain
MSNQDQDLLLRQLADTFINVANDHAETQDNNIVNTAFMYAAARFCAFVAASRALSLNDFQEKQLQGIEFFTTEFKQMLESNMRNYEKQFQPTEQLPYAKYMKKH